MSDLQAAADFPLGEYLEDELDSRGMYLEDLASDMEGDYQQNLFVLEMLMLKNDLPKDCVLGDSAKRIADALGVSEELISNLHETWRKS